MTTTMSKDRVRFTFTDHDRNRQACIDAASRAFGMNCGQAYDAFLQARMIICRPSQFARFLIYRAEKVDCNAFKQFGAELIPAQSHDPVIDVSKRPA